MKSVAIFYFSGTGNTQIVAEMVKEALINQGCAVDMLRMEDVMKKKLPLDLEPYELLGFGSQVIGYGVPNLVQDFLRLLPKGKGQKTFIFRTAGGVAPINYNASKPMIRALAQKGYDVFYERIFSIGSNWIARFSDPVMHQLYAATHKKVTLMVQDVLAGQKRFLKTGLAQQLAMETLGFVSNRVFRLLGWDYKVTSACSLCKKCIKNCPAENIYESNGKIKFRTNCSSCMRCVYNCPKQAIQYRMLSFFPVKGGYQIDKILAQPLTEGGEVEVNAPPFFKNYILDDAL
jgi:ferredoxin/flavodoxin